MEECGDIWRNMEGEDTRDGVDAWMCDSPRPSHYVNCKRFHKLAPHYLNIMNIQNCQTIQNFQNFQTI